MANRTWSMAAATMAIAAVLAPPAVSAQEATVEPGTGVWRNYDFVRGDSIWLATDWSNERVGRFPSSQLLHVSGNAEIVEREGVKLLEVKSATTMRLALPDDLPEQFTIEFNLELGAGHFWSALFTAPHEGSPARAAGDYLYLYSRPGIYRNGKEVSAAADRSLVNKLQPVKLQVDGEYAILYVGATRVAMVPSATFPRGSALEFRMNSQPDRESYVSDIVVAVGLDPLHSTLMAKGAVTSYGFLFDVDSARLRPESTPKLEELRKMLADHTDLKIAIEGHTDSSGDDAHNQDLSTRRAAAVVAFLNSNGIGAARVRAIGKGETVPVGDNTTTLGRQHNRRVVIRKL